MFSLFFPTGFGKILIYQSYSVAKSAINSVAPVVIVVVSLQSITEEQLRNSEFDLKVSIDNKSSRDPEISFNPVLRSVEHTSSSPKISLLRGGGSGFQR